MKAYKGKDGSVRLFRPDRNMERLNKSSKRIALPTFDSKALIKLIGELVKLDGKFIPK
jgi:branched-chain amino acid aminotransferase